MPYGIHSSPRGLAVADKATRQRVSQMGGFATAIYYGDLYCQERAEIAGAAQAEKYGREAYRKWGKKAARLRKKRNGTQQEQAHSTTNQSLTAV